MPDEVGFALYNGEVVFVKDCDDVLAVLSPVTGENRTRAEVGGIRLRSNTWNNPRPTSRQ